MKRFIVFLCLLSLPLLAQESEIFIPFGGRKTLPTKSSLKFIDTKVGIEAQQVCGYTDWTTATIHLPKKLLSKQYWKGVGSKAVTMAKNTLLNISGALPGMLACNASPTFCNLWNHSEIMASFEAQMTKEDCKILENIEDASSLQASSLRDCIKNIMSKTSDLTAGQAREKCLVNENNPEKGLSNSEKVNKASRLGGSESFRPSDLLRALFPDGAEIQEEGGRTSIGTKQFGRKYAMARYAKVLIPGLVIETNAVAYKSGTYQSVLDNEVEKKTFVIKDGVYKIIREIREYQNKGFSAQQIIPIIRSKYGNVENWNKEETRPVIYQSNFDGTLGVEVIPVELLVQMAGASEKEISKEESDRSSLIGLLIEKISKEKAYHDTVLELTDLRMRIESVCPVDPNLQKKEAQINCNALNSGIMASIEMLEMRRKSEDRLINAQMEVSRLSVDGRDKVLQRGVEFKTYFDPNRNENEIVVPMRSN
ncbi:MAG: hypothetical protein COV57_03060 [Candidatus Liptonbacteria bacterium CG11_big_fil_rev_8_21_14_0_20_35_14]|uniref:Integrating conjugative element protein n=1 Tax=Candidatus Liptonbacteria bacterium CG11_big_fil_rev_8_21_14_0_20_35_14 TaxID=1974634 RepID=A0A2H0N958_9BACT|nr:MAG: hypothetical protein COV57_03060 [Candidatus Liptonbacteria bacterium CG11_big_fil_rev_8_21_14_0_20_35_14]